MRWAIRKPGRQLLHVRPVLPLWFAITYGVAWGIANIVPWCYGVPGESMGPEFENLGLMVLLFFAALYGLTRAAPHPWARNGYRSWLALTPWAHPMPLPLGPVSLDWRDLLLLAPMALLARFGSHVNPLLPLVVFSMFYLLGLIKPLKNTGERAALAALGIGFGLAGVVRLWPHLWAIAGVLLSMHVLAEVGIRQSLRAFPWEDRSATNAFRKATRGLGGYFDLLGPTEPKPPRPFSAGLVTGLFLGWWVYCITEHFARHYDVRIVLAYAALLGGLIGLLRLGVYSAGHGGMPGFRERFASGRWLVPEYDQVLVGPFCTAAAGVLATATLKPLVWIGRATAPAAAGLAAALIMTVALTTGPSLRRWKLTGGHRIITGKELSAGTRNSA